MAQNKNQHFVPQFLLRRFSNDGASIGVFIPPSRFVDRAPIKGQAQRRFMYGRDLLVERLFGKLEAQWSPLLRDIDRRDTPPTTLSPAHRDLLHFLALQRGRTTAAAADHKDALANMDEFQRRAYAEAGLAPPELTALPANQHVLLALHAHLRGWPYLLDLQSIIVKNDTREWFFLSDAPVCFHNDALFDLQFGGATAYSSPGLMVFAPISPKRGTLFFDRNMYCIDGRSENRCVAASLSDVSALNALVAANAEYALYYSPNQPKEQIAEAFRLGRSARPSSRNITREFRLTEGNGFRRIFAFSPTCAQLSLKLSFLSVLPKRAKRIRQILTERSFPRHPELHCWLESRTKGTNHSLLEDLLLDLQIEHPDLYANILRPGRAFIGPIAERRIPAIHKHIVKAFIR